MKGKTVKRFLESFDNSWSKVGAKKVLLLAYILSVTVNAVLCITKLSVLNGWIFALLMLTSICSILFASKIDSLEEMKKEIKVYCLNVSPKENRGSLKKNWERLMLSLPLSFLFMVFASAFVSKELFAYSLAATILSLLSSIPLFLIALDRYCIIFDANIIYSDLDDKWDKLVTKAKESILVLSKKQEVFEIFNDDLLMSRTRLKLYDKITSINEVKYFSDETVARLILDAFDKVQEYRLAIIRDAEMQNFEAILEKKLSLKKKTNEW